MTATPHAYEELAHRAADGVEVALFWQTDADRLVLVVDDSRSGDLFELEVSSAEALDAFEHPYAYAAHRGVDYAAGLRTAVYA
jgi:murein DD-endopeptidase MepM/ murein hydrolase activator NlpD